MHNSLYNSICRNLVDFEKIAVKYAPSKALLNRFCCQGNLVVMQVEVRVTLRPTVSPLVLVSGPSAVHDQILRVCRCRAPCLTRGRVGHLSVMTCTVIYTCYSLVSCQYVRCIQFACIIHSKYITNTRSLADSVVMRPIYSFYVDSS
jgi:hypothetical protein